MKELLSSLLSDIIESLNSLFEDTADSIVVFMRWEVAREVGYICGVLEEQVRKFSETFDASNSNPRSDVATLIGRVILKACLEGINHPTGDFRGDV